VPPGRADPNDRNLRGQSARQFWQLPDTGCMIGETFLARESFPQIERLTLPDHEETRPPARSTLPDHSQAAPPIRSGLVHREIRTRDRLLKFLSLDADPTG
jgi:hypothetical protein